MDPCECVLWDNWGKTSKVCTLPISTYFLWLDILYKQCLRFVGVQPRIYLLFNFNINLLKQKIKVYILLW